MTLRIAMAQINSTVGDLDGNVKRIVREVGRAKRLGADLVVFPELAVTGYPPEDLLLRPQFIDANLRAIEEVAASATGIVVVCGFADRNDDVYNAAAVCAAGRIASRYHKVYLPNYGVFDENRYFQRGESPLVVEVGGARIGITICEDIWQPGGPARDAVLGLDAQVIVNLSASPYNEGKRDARDRMLAARASDNGVALVYTNLVGGQDELVFDGYSSAYDHEGNLLARAKGFQEDLVCVDLDSELVFRHRLRDLRHRQELALYREKASPEPGPIVKFASRGKGRRVRKPLAPAKEEEAPGTPEEESYRALVLGTGDYLRKNGFQRAVIGLSGGIDSALTAAIAADALGPKNVWCVFMPSRYSSAESRQDAERLAGNLGCRFSVIPIDDAFEAFERTLAGAFKRRKADLTEENIQSRIRGTILMALSNKFGHLVLATGNKSEGGVGYATLYGDMAGGLAVIKDVPKTMVYRLARDLNERAGCEVIPARILTKAPTAELRENQKDSDSLPEYDLLDPILRAYVEEDRGRAEIAEMGYDAEVVDWVIRQVDGAEFKRRQAPPGIKITPRAFGKDRRLPITSRFRNS